MSLSSIISLFGFDSRPAYLLIFRLDLILEYILVGYFLILVIQNNIVRNIIKLTILPFSIFCVIHFFMHETDKFRNLPVLIELMIFMVFIIFVFFEKMKLNFQVPLYQTINFWLLVGLFVYFSGIFFSYLLAENLEGKSERMKMELMIIISFVTILKNLILGVAVTVKEPRESVDDYEFSIPLEMNLDGFTPSNSLN